MFKHMDPAGDETAMFRQPYEACSPDGAEHWPVLFAKFVIMATTEPHIALADLRCISAPTLVVVGDDDLVTLEHTVALAAPEQCYLGHHRWGWLADEASTELLWGYVDDGMDLVAGLRAGLHG